MTMLLSSSFSQQTMVLPLPGSPDTETHIAYTQWGDPTNPTVLCVHGLTRNGRDFDPLANALSSEFHVLCPDMPGRGASDWLDKPEFYHNITYLQLLESFLDALSIDEVRWVGTSMGGIVAMMEASMLPGRITHLVLNDIGALIPARGLARLADYVGAVTEFATREAAEAHVRIIMKPWNIDDEATWQHMLAHYIEEHQGKWRLRYDPAIGEMFRKLLAMEQEKNKGALPDIDMWGMWEAIDCPTLILRGAESDILDEVTARQMVHAMKENGIASQLVTYANTGHTPSLMQADQIRLIRKFLRG